MHIPLLKILKIHLEKPSQNKSKNMLTFLTSLVAIFYKISLIGNTLWEALP